ncbi:MAG: hypothetical protein LWX56_08655 [Ignavibacteria bacterium]|nr:hypothetical protein [Ignavibacteria bacterium]
MMKRILVILGLVAISFQVIAAPHYVSSAIANNFVRVLLENPDSLKYFLDESESKLIDRLGISYKGITNKFFIGNLPDQEQIANISDSYKLREIGDGYTELTIIAKNAARKNTYYFLGDKVISPAACYARGWKQFSSKHFVFHISNPAMFHPYCVSRLENFLDRMMDTLQYSNDQKLRLANEKIHYYLCANSAEIEKITGFNTLGIYLLSHDFLVSIYPCHFHELAHLLINYKLHENDLFTHPFLQEGFAVAMGGRGGRQPDIMNRVGAYMQRVGLLAPEILFNREDFLQTDASMSYPMAGLYNSFLISRLPIYDYIRVYKNCSTPNPVYTCPCLDSLYRNLDGFAGYSQAYLQNNTVQLFVPDPPMLSRVKPNSVRLNKQTNMVMFAVQDTLYFGGNSDYSSYESFQYKQLTGKRKYNGEKYAVIANTDEISVYNLWSCELVAKYSKAFSTDSCSVFTHNGNSFFTVNANVFDKEDYSLFQYSKK